jgi:hypothetical protein
MVFRDYMVRCKRCHIPYKPDNVSRIRTCIFCRKSHVDRRNDRLNILINDIKTYTTTQNALPTNEIVKTWIKLKFQVEDSTVNSYLKELEELGIIAFIEDECIKRVKLLNLAQQSINS